MLKRDRAKFVLNRLNELYPETPVPLNHKNNFELLVAVLLSAQCTDERVNKVTPELFSEASNAYDMQFVPVNTIYKIIRPCGLAPQKSKAISELSKILVEKYQGNVPEDLQALEALPGVGHKTASVVISQGFGQPAFPVDTHIHRLASRWGLSRAKNVDMTERDLKKLWTEEKWNLRHLQIIFFGREYCPAQNHDLKKCLICSWSASKKRQREEMNVK